VFNDLKKFFMTIPDVDEGYIAIIQVSGFKTKEEANDYLMQYYKAIDGEILDERTTVH
jgi:hypothetical protein